ncbi:MAG: MbcA/ParS/Xre antitoxin family protein [Caldimonas sp.]
MSALLKSVPARIDPTSARAAGAALRTFFRLAEAWQLSVAEQTTLLGVARTTLYQWKQGKVAPLDRHQLERLSHLFGIYSALHILFPDAARADAWVKKPNAAPLFAGRSALARMLGGQVSDLYVVRQYLDAQRGGKA